MAKSTQGRIQGRAKICQGGGVPLQETSSDRKASAANGMYMNDLEACGMKCYILFLSEVKFLCIHRSQVRDGGPLGLLFKLAGIVCQWG